MKNTYDDDEIKRNFSLIKETINKYSSSIYTFIQGLSDDDIIEFSEYIRYIYKSHSKKSSVNMDKVKIFISLLKLSDYDTKTILSYLDSIEYGWYNNEYILRNPCLRHYIHSSHEYCKRKYTISYVEEAERTLSDICKIFLDKEYGKITLFIFSYCLVALFSTKLNQNRNTIPFFLQIACERGSILYQLISEIVEICDVNSGLVDKCPNIYEYTLCGYTHQIFNPTQNTEKGLDDLIYNNKDIPVIIDGYENERYYNALLREVSNIPGKKNTLDLRNKFNLLPLFLCSTIKSSFNNIFDMDLTDLEVSKEYLTLLRENKKRLSSWVLNLVSEYKASLFPNLNNYDKPRNYPFTSEIRTYINYISKKYPDLEKSCAENVGFLSFFFNGFTQVVQRLFTFPPTETFSLFYDSDNTTLLKKTGKENINIINKYARNKLVEIHRNYFSSPRKVGIKDKGAIRLARQIEKEYRKFRAFIRVTPIDVKEDRYIFEVDTLQNTKDTDISKNMETVQRRLKKYECFRIDLSNKKSIKLVVAEKSLRDSNLLELLQCKDFKDSKKKIPYAIGFDETGEPCIRDIIDFPHLLIAGTTQSGKSTAMMSLLISIAVRHLTGDVNVLIMDFLGKLESDFAIFNDQPFLSCPVINDPLVGQNAILALHKEAQNRLKNKNLQDMPYIVCVIDEFPRLFQNSDKVKLKQLESIINDLLSTGRHSKIDFVIAIQNPTKPNMKCGIANLSTKIALKCSHYQNSKTILGRSGAEKLIGKGQMIFDSGDDQDKRIQGSYIKVNDTKKLLSIIKQSFKQQNKYPFKLDMKLILSSTESNGEIFDNKKIFQHNSDDEKLSNAIIWSLSKSKIANYRLQKYLKSGNNVTKRILKRMEEFKLIARLHGNLGWEVVPRCIEDMSANTIEFLKSHGNTEDNIKNAFIEELNESYIQINTKQEQNLQTTNSINNIHNSQLNDTINKQTESVKIEDIEETENIEDTKIDSDVNILN